MLRLRGEVEGVADGALGAEARGAGDLRGDLLRRALVLEAAHAGVEALGVLADDDEVDVLRPLVLEGAVDVGVELDRAQVDVLVELEAQAEEDALLQDAGRDVGVADGAEEDGVELAQLVDGAVGERFAGAQVAFAAEVVGGRLVGEAGRVGGGLQDLEAFADDFGACAVAGDYCYSVQFGFPFQLGGRVPLPYRIPSQRILAVIWALTGRGRDLSAAGLAEVAAAVADASAA